jgi:ABC-type sugar transport system ATPase subunit
LASLELRNVAKSFGKVEAVRDVSLAIEDRELVVFVGPSGCGKSTLLRMIAGLEEITSGELLIGGKPMTAVAAADRGIAMVFQSYALYPHMTVAENMGFALKMLGTDTAEIDRKVAEAAGILQDQGTPLPKAEGTLGWPAPARRDRARYCAPAQRLPLR